MKTYTVLIWEWIPESMQIYLIPDDEINDDMRTLLKMAHGYHINGNADCSENDGLAFLNVALLEKTEQSLTDHANEKYIEHLGIFTKHLAYNNKDSGEVDPLQNISSPALISQIICSGFYL